MLLNDFLNLNQMLNVIYFLKKDKYDKLKQVLFVLTQNIGAF